MNSVHPMISPTTSHLDYSIVSRIKAYIKAPQNVIIQFASNGFSL